MKTRTTIFDSRISAIADILNAAVNTDVEHQVPERYIGYFCKQVVNSMWRSVSNAIAGMELYGDVVGFIFNMGGYIDTMHDIDKVRWHGFSGGQIENIARKSVVSKIITGEDFTLNSLIGHCDTEAMKYGSNRRRLGF